MHIHHSTTDHNGVIYTPKLATLSNQPSYIYLTTFVGAIGGFLFGYDTGIISGALIYLRTQMDLNEFWQELIVSVTLLTAWIASSVANIATEKLGRKPVISWSAVLLVIGSLLMAVATNRYFLFIGRSVAGLGIGLTSMATPIYLAELAPSGIRGQLGLINNVCLTGGQFIASIIAYGLSFMEPDLGWRFMLGLGAVPAFIQYVALHKMPESPRWLISKMRYDEAKEVLRKLRDDDYLVEMEFNLIKSHNLKGKQELEDSRAQHGNQSLFQRVIKTRSVRRALIMGCLLQFIQQVSGINTVMYYTATIFEMAGISSKSNALLLSSLTASFNFIFSGVGLVFIDRIGRRKLLIPSLIGIFCSLFILGLSFNLAEIYSPRITRSYNSTLNKDCSIYSTCSECVTDSSCGYCYSDASSGSWCLAVNQTDHSYSNIGVCNSNATLKDEGYNWKYEWCPNSYASFTLIGLLLYQMSFAPGLGNLPWTINSEIYPYWARDFCQSMATGVNWSSNLIIAMSFLSLTRMITKHGVFYLYGVLSLLGLVYFAIVLPETRGKSLEEMEELFDKKDDDKSKKSATPEA